MCDTVLELCVGSVANKFTLSRDEKKTSSDMTSETREDTCSFSWLGFVSFHMKEEK